MKNDTPSHSNIIASSLAVLMVVGLLPGLVSAQPGGIPPTGSVDAKFNSLQITADGTFGGNGVFTGNVSGNILYAQGSVQNNKAGVNPLLLNDGDGIIVQSGPFFDVEQPILNNATGQPLNLNDADGIQMNKITVAADSSISNSDTSVPVTLNDPDGVKVTSGSLDVTTDIKNSIPTQPVTIVDNDGLSSTIADTDAMNHYALSGIASGVGSDSGAGVYGQSEKGTGVNGSSQSGNGVYGSSNTGYGMYAKTTSGPAALYVEGGNVGVSAITGLNIGVNAQGSTTGVAGNSSAGVGVKGSSTSSDGVSASSVNGYALNATSTNGTAVRANAPNNVAIQASSSTGTAILATTTSGNGLTVSSVSGQGVSSTSTNSSAVTGVGGIAGGDFKNGIFPTNGVQLGTPSYGLVVTGGGASITGVLKATGIGSYSQFSSATTNISTGTNGTATISCPAPSSKIPISCEFNKTNPTLPLIINSTAINTAAKSCSVSAYNNSGSTITLQATVTCFDPSV